MASFNKLIKSKEFTELTIVMLRKQNPQALHPLPKFLASFYHNSLISF